jgi:heterotetrameric sarcosine oxidase gamma subunit
MFERRSALGVLHAGPGGPLTIGELRGDWRLWQVTAQPGAEAAMMASLAAQVGPLPEKVGLATQSQGRTLMLVGPAQYLLSGGPVTVPDAEGAVVELTHARTRLYLEGPDAPEVLSRGAPLDFHDSAFPVGAFAQTGIHHTPVLIHRVGQQRYEIDALRTFALTVWHWLEDACLPFGYEARSL